MNKIIGDKMKNQKVTIIVNDIESNGIISLKNNVIYIDMGITNQIIDFRDISAYDKKKNFTLGLILKNNKSIDLVFKDYLLLYKIIDDYTKKQLLIENSKGIKCPKCNTKIQKNKLQDIVYNTNKKKLLVILVSVFVMLFGGIFYYNVLSVPSLEQIKNSVVKIEAYDKDNNLIATGSGFCAYKSNYIITNFHVVEGSYSLKVVDDDKKTYHVNDILIFDYKNDLAILDADVSLKPLKINNNRIRTGKKVIAIGSPMGELNTVSEGIVSNSENDKGIQISAPISHGSSGGALFNSRHELIGITYAGYDDAQNLNYAISTEYLNKLYKALKNDDYYVINYSNYANCVSTINGFSGCDESSKNYYSVSAMDIMYDISNIRAIYENDLEYGFKSLYNNYSNENKELVVATYQELLKYDICLIYTCDIKNKLKQWDTNEFIINLDILSNKALAFVLVDLKNYNSKSSQFNRVNNDYPINAAQKSLVLYLIGNYQWSDIHKDNKKDIFEFLDNKINNTSKLGSVLELLGYDVKYNNDGTLTAYWN